MVECVSWLTRNGATPGISPFCRVPARLIWNISPLSAAHSIYPASSPRSSLLPFTFHLRQTRAWLCPNSTKRSAATSTNTLTLPLSSQGTLTKPTSGRSCRTSISMYPAQLEDRIHWIIATLSSRMPIKLVPCRLSVNRTTRPFSSHRNINKGLFRNPRGWGKWSSHSEAMLQASLDDVDWDMFRASSADVSEFTDVALSFVYMLTDQATETVTIRTFSNQKPWVDRTIRAAVNQRTAAYNAGLLSGNMSEYKASCYALRRAVRAAKLRYRERIESHFQLNDSRRMWQGLKTICSSGNNPSAEVRADPLLAEELNTFYGRFDRNSGATLPISAPGSSRQSSDDDHVITVSEDEVRRELRRVNIRKAAGPDGITGRILRSCVDQLAGLFTSIFNESLATSVIPTSFKKSVIIPVPKNSKPSCLNDYRPVALTSTVMKVFERLLKKHICSSIPATLDPLQFAYRPNRSTDDAISQVLHSSLTHIDSKNGNYVRLLFIDYSSAFNTIVPSKLAVKLSDLGLNTTLCDWIQDFLTGRPQVVKMGQFTSNSITLNVGAPQGCVLSPLLYSLYTHDCVSSHSSTSIVKFADDTVVLGLIKKVKKARQRLYHLRQLRKFRVSPAILKTFYSGAIESVLTQCISVWYSNATKQDCKALQRVVRLAERISGSALPSLQDIYLKRCKSRAAK